MLCGLMSCWKVVDNRANWKLRELYARGRRRVMGFGLNGA